MNDLLICAERLGYEAREYKDKVEILFHDQNGTVGYWYNPRTNNAQAMELLKWLIDKSMYGVDTIKIKDKINLIVDEYRLEGDTLNEAIIKAVVAMEDTHE